MLKVLPMNRSAASFAARRPRMTYARTLEKSVDGDMTKLSLLFDHEIKFWMAGSSNMLTAHQPTDRP